MHTYMKESDGYYWVGHWIPTINGDATFWKLFSVPNLKQAITAVNCLNGGSRISPDALNILEEK